MTNAWSAQLTPRGLPDDGLYHCGDDIEYHNGSSIGPTSFARVFEQLPSLEWLELPCSSSLRGLGPLTLLTGLHTLLLPFHYLDDVSGLPSCIHLTRLDLGKAGTWYEQDGIRADLEKVFGREGVPIRHIRMRKAWADLVDLANRMSPDNPYPELKWGKLTLKVGLNSIITVDDWLAKAANDEWIVRADTIMSLK